MRGYIILVLSIGNAETESYVEDISRSTQGLFRIPDNNGREEGHGEVLDCPCELVLLSYDVPEAEYGGCRNRVPVSELGRPHLPGHGSSFLNTKASRKEHPQSRQQLCHTRV